MDNNEFLATQMTQTYFSIMSPEQKAELISDVNFYIEKYRYVYDACMKKIKEQENENSYDEFTTLIGRLK